MTKYSAHKCYMRNDILKSVIRLKMEESKVQGKNRLSKFFMMRYKMPMVKSFLPQGVKSISEVAL